ncbi:MAG: DUF429 domain-containing protein [Vicinamibacteria bacterium]
MAVTIVGIDCATTDARIGVAQGRWSTDKVEVLEVALCGPDRSAVSLVTAWLRDSEFIQRTLGKTPLDVGADRIARTAHAALRLLGEIRKELALPIPLAWSLPPQGVAAIEVYPAATLLAHAVRASGYKRSTQVEARQEILAALARTMAIRAQASLLETSADALDAVVCLLAAKDFLDGRAVGPTGRELAEIEGWIWALHC